MSNGYAIAIARYPSMNTDFEAVTAIGSVRKKMMESGVGWLQRSSEFMRFMRRMPPLQRGSVRHGTPSPACHSLTLVQFGTLLTCS